MAKFPGKFNLLLISYLAHLSKIQCYYSYGRNDICPHEKFRWYGHYDHKTTTTEAPTAASLASVCNNVTYVRDRCPNSDYNELVFANGSCSKNWYYKNMCNGIDRLTRIELDILAQPSSELKCFKRKCCEKMDEHHDELFHYYEMTTIYKIPSCLDVNATDEKGNRVPLGVACYEPLPLAFAAKNARFILMVGRGLSVSFLLALILNFYCLQSKSYRDNCLMNFYVSWLAIFILRWSNMAKFFAESLGLCYFIGFSLHYFITTAAMWFFLLCFETNRLVGSFNYICKKICDWLTPKATEEGEESAEDSRITVTGEMIKDCRILCPYWFKSLRLTIIKYAQAFPSVLEDSTKGNRFRRLWWGIYILALIIAGVVALSDHYSYTYLPKVIKLSLIFNDNWLLKADITRRVLVPIVSTEGTFVILCGLSILSLVLNTFKCCRRDDQANTSPEVTQQRELRVQWFKEGFSMLLLTLVDLLFHVFFLANVYKAAWYLDIIGSYGGVLLFLSAFTTSKSIVLRGSILKISRLSGSDAPKDNYSNALLAQEFPPVTKSGDKTQTGPVTIV